MMVPAEQENGNGESVQPGGKLKQVKEESKKRQSQNVVLIVDDEPTTRQMLEKKTLDIKPNTAVYEATEGSEVFPQLSAVREKYKRDPDMIMLDLQLPNMDGWNVLERLKEQYENQGRSQGIPVVVFSKSTGEKGSFLRKKSIHKKPLANYNPLITVAKEDCLSPTNYNLQGEKGLEHWLKYFLTR